MRRRNSTLRFAQPHLTLCLFVAVLASSSYGQQAVANLDLPKLYQACSGDWAGVLEYRDFQSDKHVSLPTNLESQSDGKTLTLKYTYDDGPGKIARESTTLAVDTERGSASIKSDDNSSEQLSITEVKASASKISLVLSGTGTENEKKVEVRSTLVCAPNTFTLLRETRSPGQEFAFRHKYSFTRFPIQAQ